MNNYEKAKEEGIKEFDKWFEKYSMRVEPTMNPKCWRAKYMGETLPERINIESFLSSFAEKIKEGVEADMGEKYVLKVRESSDSQTIKE